MSPERASTAARSILFAHPAFGLYWCARVCSSLAFQMQAVAIGWQVYAITHSTLWLGLVGLAQFVPMVFLVLPAGHVADHSDRRLVCCTAAALQGTALAFLALGNGSGHLSVALIFTLVAVIGSGRAFERPAIQAMVPALVPQPLVPKAIAWSTAAFQSASIVGPALGGILFALGPAVAYAAAAGFGFTGAVVMAAVRYERPERSKVSPTLRTLFSGVHFIRTNPVILGSTSLDLFAVLLGGATALLPAFAHDILRVGSQGLGALRSAPAIGSIAMSVFLARRSLGGSVGKKMFSAVVLFGMATIAFGLSRSFALSFGALLVLGAADTVSVVIRSSLVQLRTPDDMRGRVGAVNGLFIGTSNQLGEFESGVTAALMGTVTATVVGGIGTLVVAALWIRLFPSLYTFDRLGNEP